MMTNHPVVAIIAAIGCFHAGWSLDPQSKVGQPVALGYAIADAVCSQFGSYQDDGQLPQPVTVKPGGSLNCGYFDLKCNGEINCRFEYSSCNDNGALDNNPGGSGADDEPRPAADTTDDDINAARAKASKKKLGTRIVGGAKAKKYKYPSIVLLRNQGKHICSGTILNEEFVITAAHCFLNFNPSDYEMTAAEYNRDRRDGYEQNVTATKIFIHADYNDENQENDIALLKVEPKFQFNDKVKAVTLPDKTYEPTPNTKMWFAGWGRLVEDGETPDIINEVSLPIVHHERCKKVLADFVITDKQLCAGGQGGKDTCEGDSGGPMYLVEGTEQTLVGIVSWGLGCAEVGLPGVYTRVTSYLDWISEKLIEGRRVADIRKVGKGGSRLEKSKLRYQSVQASPNEYPSIVLIKFNDKHVCSGTIVDKRWVLSAAHCFKEKAPSSYTVVAGDFNKDQGEGSEKALGVKSINLHLGYKAETLENDIALLELSSELSFGSRKIQPAILPAKEYKPTGKLTSAGWGRLSKSKGLSPVLQEVDVDLVNPFQCIDWLETPTLYTELVICVGFQNETRDICLGGPGSPLFTIRGGNHYLVGVSSWGETCARRNSPRVYTKVSQYLDWINQIVNAPDLGRSATGILKSKSGLEAEPKTFPSIVMLQKSGRHTCSATIVNREWVVTAAHCITSRRASDYVLIAGVHDKEITDSSQQAVMASLIVIHPNYANGTKHDVALLRVNPPFRISEYVKPASVANRAYHAKREVTIVGWGVGENIELAHNTLQRASIKTVSVQECGLGLNPNKFFCAGSQSSTVNPCIGDTGGPMFNVNGGIQKLIGIAGRRRCSDPDQPQLYTNAIKYVPWIVRTMESHKAPKRSGYQFVGRKASEEEFTSLVVILLRRKPHCVGTLLGKGWIATSASCVSGHPMSSIRVQAGVYDLRDSDSKGQISDLAGIYEYPKSKNDQDLNNIALIKLNTPMEFGKNVGKATGSTEFDADSLTAVGWGINDEGLHSSNIIQKAILRKSEGCVGVEADDMKFQCLQNPAAEKEESCVGDRGSPVFTPDGHLFAIVSAESPCGEKGNPSLAIKIAPFASWIKATMEESQKGSADTTIQAIPL